MRASVGRPGFVHMVLALLSVAGIVGAFLLIARSSAEPALKAGTVVVASVKDLSPWRALYVTVLTTLGGANADLDAGRG